LHDLCQYLLLQLALNPIPFVKNIFKLTKKTRVFQFSSFTCPGFNFAIRISSCIDATSSGLNFEKKQGFYYSDLIDEL
jgi:hypothetical protein